MFKTMETHVKACGNELLNTPSEAVNQQLQFCIDTDTHTHTHTHAHTYSACKWEWEAMRCEVSYSQWDLSFQENARSFLRRFLILLGTRSAR